MPTRQATLLRSHPEIFRRVRGKARVLAPLILLAAIAACQRAHEPIVEAESIEADRSPGDRAEKRFPGKIPGMKAPGSAVQMPHSSTGIVLLNPSAPRVDTPGSALEGDNDPDSLEDDGSASEPETLLIREPWPNPVARGGVEAGDFGFRFDAIQFGYDSYDLDFAARQRLTGYCAWLEEHPDAWVTLEGHCDERGSSDYNYNLGMTRAWAAKDWMVGLGIDPTRLHTISYGEEQPLAMGRSPDAYSINRRVEFRPFHPTRNGRFLTSLKEGPEAPGDAEVQEIPPPQPPLKLEAADAAWPPLTE
jgi:outer membrane protein OmpA-like peptidoglycan-associated protein